MREIKFKAKRLDNGKWVEGGIWTNIDYRNGKEKAIVLDGLTKTIVAPETLCQFTGLYDRNGKEIWEGDIVTFLDGCGYNYGDEFYNAGVIIFEDGSFSITNRNAVRMTDLIGNGHLDGSVIGNIFDNKELLEVEE